MRKKISRYLLYLSVLCLRRFFLLMPLKMALSVGGFLGKIAYYLDRTGRAVAFENLKNAFPHKSASEIKQICKKVYENQGKNFAEFVNFPKLDKSTIRQKVHLNGQEILEKVHKKGKGTIIITGHFGNWELLAAVICSLGYKLNATARPFYIDKINEILVKNRQRSGLKLIMRNEKYAVRDILKAIKDNEMVGLIIDQDTDVAGDFVKFFSRDAYTPTGPATIALKTNCSVIYAFIVRNRDNTHTAYFEEASDFARTGDVQKDILTNTQIFTSKIEEYVRSYPDQWVWFHRRWKTQKKAGIEKS